MLCAHGIGDESLECGQIWVLSPGGDEEHPGLFRLEVNEGPGGGVRVLNKPVPAAFKETIRCAEQNLYAPAQELVGDRDPGSHEFSVQLRGFDAAKAGAKTDVGALPERLDDWIHEDSPVRVIDVFVDELDLRKLGFERAEPASTGWPAYSPTTLLKIYV